VGRILALPYMYGWLVLPILLIIWKLSDPLLHSSTTAMGEFDKFMVWHEVYRCLDVYPK
jgi:hypothetical protein